MQYLQRGPIFNNRILRNRFLIGPDRYQKSNFHIILENHHYSSRMHFQKLTGLSLNIIFKLILKKSGISKILKKRVGQTVKSLKFNLKAKEIGTRDMSGKLSVELSDKLFVNRVISGGFENFSKFYGRQNGLGKIKKKRKS